MPQTSVMYPSRVINTVVLPLPGTASSSTGPCTASTAARCCGFSAAIWADANSGLSMAAPFGK